MKKVIIKLEKELYLEYFKTDGGFDVQFYFRNNN